jgi:hypothetical protein
LEEELCSFHQIQDEALDSITQMLEAMGAETRISLTETNLTTALKGFPSKM